MTDEMLALALSNKRTAAAHNAVFIKGTMEDIPLPDGSVDVIISNCVINLSPDKPKALSELKRVLRPGGRLAIQDVVLEGVIPEDLKGDSRLWCECVSGSMSLPEYEEKLRTAGFTAISFIVDGWYEQEATAARGFRIGSAFVSAQRPTGVEPARKSDLAAIEELLKAAGLPTDGVADNIEHFSLVRDGDSVIACAGVELYGGQALLRSVCVAESHRGEGWGKALTDVVQEQARRAGAREIYLLTTTAGGYFEKLGFDRVERSKLFGPVLQSVEFESACPVTATVMNKRFKTPDRQRCC
jgi:N-acetylglutamate synthase-like GNAT family acetyltransferase